mmetsp:Transcript_11453/g.35365  ORF Transcript_11453/g.35365 Transcript_11453/m.35365 type:complete len:295 (+) Transcript_11453:2128-3012(+)
MPSRQRIASSTFTSQASAAAKRALASTTSANSPSESSSASKHNSRSRARDGRAAQQEMATDNSGRRVRSQRCVASLAWRSERSLRRSGSASSPWRRDAMDFSSGSDFDRAARASPCHRRAVAAIACSCVTSSDVTRSSSASRSRRWRPPRLFGETPRRAERSSFTPPLPHRTPPSFSEVSESTVSPAAGSIPSTSMSSISASCRVSGSSTLKSPRSSARARACHDKNCVATFRNAASDSGSTSHASPLARTDSRISYRSFLEPPEPSPPPCSALPSPADDSSRSPAASACHDSA